MLKGALLLLCAVFALVICCSKRNETITNVPEGTTAIVPRLQAAPVPEKSDGPAVYAANCARCHGDEGEGTKKGIPLISGHALHHTADEYIKQVNNGKDKKMPGFKDKLSPEDIAAVVDFVRNVLQPDARHRFE